MIKIDDARCNGCGNCIDTCPQQAISLYDGRAVINQELCVQCLACVESCPVGAIREVVPTYAQIAKGGDSMPYGDGTGPRGMGPMTGRGAGYCTGFGWPGFANLMPRRGWFGLGWRGQGRGRGRGFGRRWYAPYYYPRW